MTADEIAAELHQKQGYLVIGFREKPDMEELPDAFIVKLEIHYGASSSCGDVSIPMKITGESSLDEMVRQCNTVAGMMGWGDPGPCPYSYFYRVEAAD